MLAFPVMAGRTRPLTRLGCWPTIRGCESSVGLFGLPGALRAGLRRLRTVSGAANLPAGTRFVAESGIVNLEDVVAARKAGACAVLVGESLLRATNIGVQIDLLMNR